MQCGHISPYCRQLCFGINERCAFIHLEFWREYELWSWNATHNDRDLVHYECKHVLVNYQRVLFTGLQVWDVSHNLVVVHGHLECIVVALYVDHITTV